MKWLLALVALALAVPAVAQEDSPMLIIAHRGASGERPEHTLAAYERAIDQGADYVEPDLVPTKDGVLVARHENEISGTTDVADRPEFADRRTTKTIDSEEVTGWFTEDFTLAELRTLRARERLPQVRVANTRFDGLYQVPTLAEVIALVRAKEAETGRSIGLYPEMKHPTYFAGLGFDMPAMLLAGLHAGDYFTRDDPIFIQCFEVSPLVQLRALTEMRLVQLVDASGGPADQSDETFASMVAPEGLINIAQYADGIGASLGLLLDAEGKPTPLTRQAQAQGLLVHAWTLRKENAFLPPRHRSSDAREELGRMADYWDEIAASGLDGVFTDDPVLAFEFVIEARFDAVDEAIDAAVENANASRIEQ
jgi:glycerophosphoryl diester phosphodiesterase